MQGVNLLDDAVLAKRNAIYGEIFLHTAVDLDKPGPNLRYRWVIEGNWKLILPVSQTRHRIDRSFTT